LHLKGIYVKFIDSGMNEQIKKNVAEVRNLIRRAAEKSGRKEGDITVVGVSKRQPVEKIYEAHRAGIKIFGENRVQELVSKISTAERDLNWHMIGHLQGNKANKVVGKVDMIQSIDSLNLIERLTALGEQRNYTSEILLQVNTSGEASKFGFQPEQVENICEAIENSKYIVLKGLMTIGPLTRDRGLISASFAKLRSLYEGLKKYKSSKINTTYLSMGMSDDFEMAILEGSNLVRIGTAIFGPREAT